MTSKRPSGKARAAQPLAAAARLPSRLPGSFDLKEVAAEDVGSIFRLEHVNLRVPDHKPSSSTKCARSGIRCSCFP